MYPSMDSRFRFHSKHMLLSTRIVMLTLILCYARSRSEISWVSSIKLRGSRKLHMSRNKKGMQLEGSCSGQGIDPSRSRSSPQLFWNREGNRKWGRRTFSPSEATVRWSQSTAYSQGWPRPRQQTRQLTKKHSESLWSAWRGQTKTSWTSPTK